MQEIIQYHDDVKEISLFMPLTLKKRGGCKMILVPEGGAVIEKKEAKKNPVLLKALVRAHLWQIQIKKGRYLTYYDLFKAHGISQRYGHRIFRLNYLSPALKERILNGTLPQYVKLVDLDTISILWEKQEDLVLYGRIT